MTGPRLRGVARALAAGLLWLTALFTFDTLDSIYLLGRSLDRIESDETTTAALQMGVARYVGGIASAYLLLGLLAAGAVGLGMRVWYPAEPAKRWRWWASFGAAALLVSLVASVHQMLAFPGLEEYWPLRRWACDTFVPDQVNYLWAALGLSALGLSAQRWRAAGQPLGALGGRVVAWSAWMLGCALLLRHPGPEQAVDNESPNVVLIGIDALRPDHLGANGYFRDTSPNIDAFLAESAVFTSAWTQFPRTYPSWVSILTGMLPIHHGIRDNLPEADRLVPKGLPMLPQVMGAAGWATTFVTDDSRFSYMVPDTGFQDIVQPEVGVTNFAVSVNEPRFRSFYGLMANPIGYRLVPAAAYNQSFGKSYRPNLFATRAVTALSDASKRGRFLYAIHSCVLHEPGDRSYPWYHKFDQDEYKGPNRFAYAQSALSLLDPTDGKKDGGQTAAEQDTRIYDAGIDMADGLVASLVGELKRSGLWDNSIVVLLSDHGENLWAPDLPYKYRSPNHGFHAYGDGQHQVTLAIHFPDGAHKGERFAAPVRLIDLAPTLKELLGLSWEGTFDGESLLPILAGQVPSPPREVYIETGLSESRYWKSGHVRYPFSKVSERYDVDDETGLVHIRPKFRGPLIRAKDRTLQEGDWKLVWHAMKSGTMVELFNRAEDPENRVDLALAHPDIVARLGKRLQPYLEADGVRSPIFAQWDALLAAPRPP